MKVFLRLLLSVVTGLFIAFVIIYFIKLICIEVHFDISALIIFGLLTIVVKLFEMDTE